MNQQIRYILLPAFGLLIMFGFGYLPTIDPISAMGMKILGIFIGLIFLWSFCDILWPSLVGIVALLLSGYAPLPNILAATFGNPVAIIVFLTMILFGAIQGSGITNYLSRWLLTRKIINGRPFLFSFVFYIQRIYSLQFLAMFFLFYFLCGAFFTAC